MSLWREKGGRRWRYEYVAPSGQRRRLTLFSDKAASQASARRIDALVEAVQSGLGVPHELRRWYERLPARVRTALAGHGTAPKDLDTISKPLDYLLRLWGDAISRQGRTEVYVRQRVGVVSKALASVGARHWADLDRDAFDAFLAQRRRKDGISHRRSNEYLGAARQFCSWVVSQGWASENPMRGIRRLPEAKDRRRIRRPFTTVELEALLRSTTAGPVRRDMSGPERALLYALAVETGLRQVELRRLRCSMLRLDSRPAIVMPASATKNGRDARLPLREELARRLRSAVAGRQPSAAVFGIPKTGAAQILQSDLEVAGIALRDELGRVLDWHSFRYTTATWLVRSGASVAEAQRLLRHATPQLTLGVYTVLGEADQRQALDRMPPTLPPCPDVDGAGDDLGSDLGDRLGKPLPQHGTGWDENRPSRGQEGGSGGDSDGRSIRSGGQASDAPSDVPPPACGDQAPGPLEPLGGPVGEGALAELLQLWAGLSRAERRELIAGLRERARRGGRR